MDKAFSSEFDNFSELMTPNSTPEQLTKSSARQMVSVETVATVGMVVSSVAVIANAVVLLVLVRARRQFGMQQCTYTLITNQSAMDLFAAVSAIPVYIMMLTRDRNRSGNRILDCAICVIFEGAGLAALGLTAEKVGLMVITIERYFKIVHAIAHRKYYRDWMTKVGVALPWISAMCCILLPAMGTTRIVNGRCLRMGVWPNEAMSVVCLHFMR